MGQHAVAEEKIKVQVSNSNIEEILEMDTIHLYEFQVASETDKMNDLVWAVNEGNPHFSPFVN